VTKTFTIDRALLDKNLLGAALGAPETWALWLVILKAAFGQELSRSERRAFASVAGSRRPPKTRVRELWAIIGRRAGKSRIAAALAVYFAAFVPHKLAPGERGMVLVLAASTEQAKATFSYALAFMRESPILRREVVEATQSEIRLRNGVIIAIHSNSFRTIRGRTLVACIFDEIAFWHDATSAMPDNEVLTAVLPAMAAGGFLVALSSPYRKTGLLHDRYKDYFGVDNDGVLVVQGGTRLFNSTLTEKRIGELRSADAEGAPSEWDAQFRSGKYGFLSDDDIDRAIDHDRPRELLPRPNVTYAAYADPNGGGQDAYTIAIGHKEGDLKVIDVVRGKHRTPRQTTLEFAALCKAYRIKRVVGDNYGKDWVQDAWRETGLPYDKAEQPAAQMYLEAQPSWVQGTVRIHNDPVLIKELRHLEMIPGRIGRDQVTHPRNMHDDYANAVCGCVALLAKRSKHFVVTAERMASIRSYHHRRRNLDDPRLSHETIYQRQLRENRRRGGY
jgi:hypothetical protein